MSSLDAVAAGKVDISLNSITPTAARKARFDFTNPYITMPFMLAGRSASKGDKPSGKVGVPGDRAHAAVSKRFPSLIKPRTRKMTVAITAQCNLRCIMASQPYKVARNCSPRWQEGRSLRRDRANLVPR